jgi:hypothetical protein
LNVCSGPVQEGDSYQGQDQARCFGPQRLREDTRSLALARQLVGLSGRIALIDTENGSASLYADQQDFDVIDLTPPYESRFFSAAIDAAVTGGYDVVVIDSLTHEWEGSGGILDRKTREERATPNANGFAIWGKYKEEHRRFVAHLLQAPIHVIACMRAREEHVQEGRKVTKVGLAPIQGENVSYEFSVLFELSLEHLASVSKDRTGIFDGKVLTDNPGGQIGRWLSSAAAENPAVGVVTDETSQELDRLISALEEQKDSKAADASFWLTSKRGAVTEGEARKVLAGSRRVSGPQQGPADGPTGPGNAGTVCTVFLDRCVTSRGRTR